VEVEVVPEEIVQRKFSEEEDSPERPRDFSMSSNAETFVANPDEIIVESEKYEPLEFD